MHSLMIGAIPMATNSGKKPTVTAEEQIKLAKAQYTLGTALVSIMEKPEDIPVVLSALVSILVRVTTSSGITEEDCIEVVRLSYALEQQRNTVRKDTEGMN